MIDIAIYTFLVWLQFLGVITAGAILAYVTAMRG